MGDARQALLDRLRRDAWRRGRFVLASGKESDFFIDCKRVVLTAEGHRLVGEALWDEVRRAGWSGRFDTVSGVALGGCPLASALSLTSALRGDAWDALYVRKEAKDHGTAQRVEGSSRGPATLLVEDVLTTGGSSRAAIEALRAAGHTVVGVIALVDRGEGGPAALEALGVPARALFTRADFVEGAP